MVATLQRKNGTSLAEDGLAKYTVRGFMAAADNQESRGNRHWGPVFPEGIAAGPQAKKPATAGAGRASWGLPTLPVDPVVCGTHYYAESAASNAGLPPELKAFRFA